MPSCPGRGSFQFKVFHPSTGDQYYSAENSDDAKAQFKRIWNVEPQTPPSEVAPGTVLSGSNYFLIDKKTGQKVVTFNNVESEEDAQRLYSNYYNNPLHAGKDLQLVKAPSLAERDKEGIKQLRKPAASSAKLMQMIMST